MSIYVMISHVKNLLISSLKRKNMPVQFIAILIIEISSL